MNGIDYLEFQPLKWDTLYIINNAFYNHKKTKNGNIYTTYFSTFANIIAYFTFLRENKVRRKLKKLLSNSKNL